jgi:hypothetical protein
MREFRILMQARGRGNRAQREIDPLPDFLRDLVHSKSEVGGIASVRSGNLPSNIISIKFEKSP